MSEKYIQDLPVNLAWEAAHSEKPYRDQAALPNAGLKRGLLFNSLRVNRKLSHLDRAANEASRQTLAAIAMSATLKAETASRQLVDDLISNLSSYDRDAAEELIDWQVLPADRAYKVPQAANAILALHLASHALHNNGPFMRVVDSQHHESGYATPDEVESLYKLLGVDSDSIISREVLPSTYIILETTKYASDLGLIIIDETACSIPIQTTYGNDIAQSTRHIHIESDR